MKFIKTIFLISLFNFILVGSIVLAIYKPEKQNNFETKVVLPTPTLKLTNNKVVLVPTKKVIENMVPTVDNRCIIVVDSTQYDISVFKNRHSGGDIFSCGTDMSAIFHGQHDNSFLSKLAPYKI